MPLDVGKVGLQYGCREARGPELYCMCVCMEQGMVLTGIEWHSLTWGGPHDGQEVCMTTRTSNTP